jgi:hypothetical protein
MEQSKKAKKISKLVSSLNIKNKKSRTVIYMDIIYIISTTCKALKIPKLEILYESLKKDI